MHAGSVHAPISTTGLSRQSASCWPVRRLLLDRFGRRFGPRPCPPQLIGSCLTFFGLLQLLSCLLGCASIRVVSYHGHTFRSWRKRRSPPKVSWIHAQRKQQVSPPAPLLKDESFQQTRQLAEVRLRFQVKDEVEDGVVGSLIDDARDDTAVLGDHFVC